MTSSNSIRPLSLLIILSIVIFGCVSHRDYITDSDYSYDGNFKKYRTFDFIKNASQDTLHNHQLMKNTMMKRMGAQGYEKTTRKPDLLIMYRIFYDDFYLRGYNQPKFESWVGADAFLEGREGEAAVELDNPDEYYDDEDEDIEGRKGEYMEQKYCMHEGTLFVVFYDRRRKKTVWQGYASGVFARDDGRSDRHIKAATAKIFNEFRLLANGFLLKG